MGKIPNKTITNKERITIAEKDKTIALNKSIIEIQKRAIADRDGIIAEQQNLISDYANNIKDYDASRVKGTVYGHNSDDAKFKKAQDVANALQQRFEQLTKMINQLEKQ